MARRELNIKPSCAHEIHGLPPRDAAHLWEKIGFLLENPLPDGKLKTKLEARPDLYRLRVGERRVFYSFGDTWVRLLAIRSRKEAYTKKNQAVAAEAPSHLLTESEAREVDPAAFEERDERAGRASPRPFVFSAASPNLAPARTPLPRALTLAWLRGLRVPVACLGVLQLCTSEEELLAASVPDSVLQRVVDNLFPRSVEEIVAQPDLLVQSVEDLVRFKEGTLVAFLLQLDAAQQKLIDWALRGPTLVRGGAGTGKSTVALYRVRALLRRPRAKGNETALFATYTTALKAASAQLLEQLLDAGERKRVRIATCDEIAREIVAAHRPVGELLTGFFPLLRQLRQGFLPPGPTTFERKLRQRALAKLTDAYLLDEFTWVIEGQELTTLDDYLSASRPGRGVAIGPKLREAVWSLYRAFVERIAESGKETFSSLRSEALALVLASPAAHAYDHVLLDEAQDLPPVALRLMANLARSPEGIFFAADDKQSIYARGYGYTSVDPRLSFKGRTALLTQNYRSTAEIDRAAFSLLLPEQGEQIASSESPHTGPAPVLLRGVVAGDEPRWAVKFLREMARHLRIKPSAAAVLVPDRETGLSVAKGMTQAGLEARFFASGELDLGSPAVKVLTMHGAKGLEFPSVVVCAGHAGGPGEGSDEEDPGAREEALRRHRRLLYVAATRAMRGLMVMVPAASGDAALQGIGVEHWSVVEARNT
jgi:superfamily I DNA/RNA helicase/mRNA-degrading endonuclease RelE of RelBE toxin-antitoxin system